MTVTYQAEVARFRRRPTEIQAVQWADANAAELTAFAGDRFMTLDAKDRIPESPATATLRTSKHETWSLLYPGDWVIRRSDGIFDVLRGCEFTDRYEPAPSERIKHSGPHTEFCVLCLSGEHERVDDEPPAHYLDQWP